MCVCMCICVCAYVYMYIMIYNVYVCMCVCIYIYMYVCVYIYIYICMCIYIYYAYIIYYMHIYIHVLISTWLSFVPIHSAKLLNMPWSKTWRCLWFLPRVKAMIHQRLQTVMVLLVTSMDPATIPSSDGFVGIKPGSNGSQRFQRLVYFSSKRCRKKQSAVWHL